MEPRLRKVSAKRCRSSQMQRVYATAARRPSNELTALVIGSGMCGLSAAKALSPHFGNVSVVERDDPLPKFPTGQPIDPEAAHAYRLTRKGVHQIHHAHLLHARGAMELETLFPGLDHKLRGMGAATVRSSDILNYRHECGPVRGKDPAQPGLTVCTRALLEIALRQRLEEEGHVSFHSNSVVRGLVLSNDNGCIAGVQLGDGSHMAADLVVDASGMGSRTADWLADKGYSKPPVTQVPVAMGYVSAFFQMNEQVAARLGFRMAFVIGAKHMGAMVPAENGMVQVIIGAYGPNVELPIDSPSMVNMSRMLPTPLLHELLSELKPAAAVNPHRGIRNVYRHFDKVPLPSGLLVLGDAYASFNPVYAQGMTVSAIQANVLERGLAKVMEATAQVSEDEMRAAVGRSCAGIMADVSQAVEFSWGFATTQDKKMMHGKSALSIGDRLLDSYVGALHKTAAADLTAQRAYFGISTMVLPPSAIFEAPVVWSVLKNQLSSWTDGFTSRVTAEEQGPAGKGAAVELRKEAKQG